MSHSYVECFTDMDVAVLPQGLHRFTHTNLEIAVFDDGDPPCLIGLYQPHLYDSRNVTEPHATIVQDPADLAIHVYLPLRMSGHVFVRSRTDPPPPPCTCEGCRYDRALRA